MLKKQERFKVMWYKVVIDVNRVPVLKTNDYVDSYYNDSWSSTKELAKTRFIADMKAYRAECFKTINKYMRRVENTDRKLRMAQDL